MVSIAICQPFVSHSQHRRFGGDIREAINTHPAQRVRFVADSEVFIAKVDSKDEAGIEMVVRRIVATRRDQMDVHVEERSAERLRGESGFFERFAACHAQWVVVTVTVATKLQPAIELSVMRQQHVGTRPVDDPRGPGHVAHPAVTPETVRLVANEPGETIDRARLLRVSLAILREQLNEMPAIHRTMMPPMSLPEKET
jgi:hypothetical protein